MPAYSHYALIFTTIAGVSSFAPTSPSLAFTRSSPTTSVTTSHPTTCPCPSCSSSTSLSFSTASAGCTCGACSTKTHGAACTCGACSTACHGAACTCTSCSSVTRTMTRLYSEPTDTVAEPAAETADADAVPAAVEAAAAPRDRPAGPGATKAKRPARPRKPSATAELIGQTLTGTVKTVTAYGAFVDIGYSSDGLVHISRVCDDFVSDVTEIVQVGSEVSVRVLAVDLEKKQIALTMRSEEAEAKANDGGGGGGQGQQGGKRRPQRSGGDRSAQQAALNAMVKAGHDDGKFVEGEVVSTLAFGAFVRFSVSSLVDGAEGELDGLVHISSLSTSRVEDVESVVKKGDKVQIRVKEVSPDDGKVSLSMLSKEDEPAPRAKGGKKGGPRVEERFTAGEMGAKDWKESMEAFQAEENTFSNGMVMQETR